MKIASAAIVIYGLLAAPASQCRNASAEVQSQARSGRALIPDNLNCQLLGERCIWFIEESLKCLDLINLTQADNTQEQQLQFAQIMIYELRRTCLSVCYCAAVP